MSSEEAQVEDWRIGAGQPQGRRDQGEVGCKVGVNEKNMKPTLTAGASGWVVTAFTKMRAGGGETKCDWAP